MKKVELLSEFRQCVRIPVPPHTKRKPRSLVQVPTEALLSEHALWRAAETGDKGSVAGKDG